MAQDKFQLNVHPWREVLLMRATGYPLFIIRYLRFTFAIVATGRRRVKYNYTFQNRDSSGPGIFASPQPVSDERYVDYGLAQFDNQAHAVESLLNVYLAFSLVDWFPSWIFARYRHNPVWANGRHCLPSPIRGPSRQLAQFTTSEKLAGLVEELDRRPYEPNTPLPSDLPPPPPPPPRGAYISQNLKEREIDPVFTCVLAFVVLSSIDASIRWAKILTLRVLPTSWRFPDSITICHRPIPAESPQELEEYRREWDGPVASIFQKQQSRRLSFGRRTTQSAAQSSGNANTPSSPSPGHGQPNPRGNVPLAPILLRDGLRILREYQRLFLYYFVGYMQWEVILGFAAIELVLNTIYLIRIIY
ncbi:hypothetical protein NW765_006969 [Fusarium oxysporum]|nr:hypothetical protein FOWG_11840 [Fusarium oxysporum f. sp. lycopersici MN25]KAJ4123924.1 hypothetical protein NW765_006969 [Fusarium oxysporum]